MLQRVVTIAVLLSLCATSTEARVIVLREGRSDPLFGLFTGTDDNTITGHFPDLSQPPDVGALNVSSLFPESRGGIVRFDIANSAMASLAPHLTSAKMTLWTVATSAVADQDMPVSAAVLKQPNSGWFESTITWRHKNSLISQPWNSGTNGPMTAGVDYYSPATTRVVAAAEMNSSGTPVRFALDPTRVANWTLSPAENAGVFYWSTLQDNGGANLDDNFQVHSSESGTIDQRPTLTLRFNTPYTRAIFDEADNSINNGDGYKNADNSNRTLTWGESYILRAYPVMYQATRDTYYLDKLIDHADAVMANRDDFANFPHELPGNLPVWTSAPDGETSLPLTSGHIVQGMIKFARLVNEDPVLSANPTYSAKATEYIARAQESIAYFDANYLETVSNPTRSYYAPTQSSNATDAVNTDGSLGNLFLDLYHATGNAAHLTRANELAQTIETNAFYTTSQGNTAWSYKYNTGPTDAEDFSHAAQSASFLTEMARSGQTVSAFDALGIAKSVVDEAYQNGGSVTAGIDGLATGNPFNRAGGDPFNWEWGVAGDLIDLAQFDLRMIPVAEAVQLQRYGAGSYAANNGGVSWPMLGIAKLVRYAKVPQELEATLSVDVGGSVYATSEPLVGSLLEPNEVLLVNENNPTDIHQVTIDFGGSGNELTELWQLSLDLDVSSAPLLLGGSLDLDLTLIDGNGEVKNILGSAITPGGFSATLSSGGDSLNYSGTLSSSHSFLVNADEDAAAGVARGWRSDISGDWEASGNWSPFGVPNSTASSAVLGNVITAPQTVFTNDAVTMGSLLFDSNTAYIVAGAGSITLQGDGVDAVLEVDSGQHEFQVVLNLGSNTTADIATGSKLDLNRPFNLQGNTLTKIGGGELAINNVLTTNGGLIDIQAGIVTGNGIITGSVFNSSIISPGNSPGELTIVGDYTQESSAVLLMEISGPAPGSEYDVLNVTVSAVLAGRLEIMLTGDYEPSAGDQFQLLNLATISGMFDAINLPALDAGFAWKTSSLYTEGLLSVGIAVPEPATSTILMIIFTSLILRRCCQSLHGRGY